MDVTSKLLSGDFTKEEMLTWPTWKFVEVVEDYSTLEKMLEGGDVTGSQLELTKRRLDDPESAESVVRALREGGHTELLGVALQHKPELGTATVDDASSTPLHVASRQGQSTAVDMLLKSGSQVNPSDKDSWTPLELAAEAGNVDTVRALLEAGAGYRGRKMLLWAAKEGRSRAVVTLAVAGADVNIRDKGRRTALHWAAVQCDEEAVRALLEAGAKRNALDRDKSSPLHWAAGEGNASVVQLLLRGANVYLKDENGWTPLHYTAFFTDSVETAKKLMKAGADTCLRVKDGRSLLHLAAEGGRVEMVRLLLKEIDVNETYAGGWTPLHLAVGRGHLAVIRELLAAGADTAAPDKHGITPMHVAAQQGHVNVVQQLVGEVDVNVKGPHRCTPLHIAAAFGHTSVVRVLLDAKANKSARSLFSKTAYDMCQGKMKELLKY